MRTDRVKFHPYGLAGGEPGGPSRNYMVEGDVTKQLPAKITMRVGENVLIVHEQAGAGGFGNPLERDPDAVLEDYLDQKISKLYAKKHYKVIFSGGGVDLNATKRLRG